MPVSELPQTESLDELLLHICVAQDPQFIASAWERWQAQTTIEAADSGLHRLVPLLQRNLERAGVQHPSMAKFRGAIRQAWAKNQRLLDAVRPALQAMANSCPDLERPLIALGDTALAHRLYPQPGMRSMGVFDVAVPPAQAECAMRTLEAHGWQVAPPTAQVHDPAFRTWIPVAHFRNRSEQIIRLHWRLVPLAPSSALDRTVGERVRPVAETEPPLAVPGDTDLFWMTCLAASDAAPASLIGLADSALLMRAASGIDWPRVVQLSTESRLTRQVDHALRKLAKLPDVEVPAPVLEAIGQEPVRGYDDSAFRAGLIPAANRTPRQRLALHYAQYRRTLAAGGQPATPSNAAAFMQHSYHAKSMLGLPALLVRKGWRQLARNQHRNQ